MDDWKDFFVRAEREVGVELFVGFAHDSEEYDLWLTPLEEASLGHRASGRRRLDFLIGRAAARRALEAAGHTDGEVLTDESGAPVWPDGLVGSISHSAGRAVAVVGSLSATPGIGVDMEHRRAVDEIESLVAFGLELQWLQSQPDAVRADRLLELFAAKESLFKAVFPGYGRFFGFEAVRLKQDRAVGRFVARFPEPLDGFDHHDAISLFVGWSGDAVLALAVLGDKPDENHPHPPSATKSLS